MFNKSKDKLSEDISNSSNIIGKGTHVSGNMETLGNIRVEGSVTGDIKSQSKVAFGQSSKLEGNLLAKCAEVAGHIIGTVEITEQLVLKPTAIIEGDIITHKLLVESGAVFNGKCKMGQKSKEIKIENLQDNKMAINA